MRINSTYTLYTLPVQQCVCGSYVHYHHHLHILKSKPALYGQLVLIMKASSESMVKGVCLINLCICCSFTNFCDILFEVIYVQDVYTLC